MSTDKKPELPPEAKPEKPVEKPAPKAVKEQRYSVECDYLQTRGGKIRKGQSVSHSAIGDAAAETLLKAGRIKRA